MTTLPGSIGFMLPSESARAGRRPYLEKPLPQVAAQVLCLLFSVMLTLVTRCSAKANLNRQGIMHYFRGHDEEAIAAFSAALEIKPDAKLYNNRGAVYASTGHYDRAISDFNHALEIEPRHVWAYYYNKAAACEVAGRKEEAIEAYQGLILSISGDRGLAHWIDPAKQRITELQNLSPAEAVRAGPLPRGARMPRFYDARREEILWIDLLGVLQILR